VLLTEQEAATKRCTQALVVLIMEAERLSGLQARTENVSTKCIGSACMNWRWYKPNSGGHFGKYGPTAEPSDTKANVSQVRGYCGLAGFIS